MPRHDLPTADVPIFAFLLTASCVMCCFGFLVYWLMQPTVLPSKEFVQEPLRPAAFVLTPSLDVEDREKASLALAQQENAGQGLRILPVVTAAIPETKPEVHRAKPAKLKRVAKEKEHDQAPKRRDSWVYANPNGAVFPLFGGWLR